MRKTLLTYADGPTASILGCSVPTFAEYAKRHGYDLVVGQAQDIGDRPPHWHKIKLLQAALGEADTVFWLDADCMICDFSTDIADELADDDFQGLVMEQFQWRTNPNNGVWVLRSTDEARQLLDEVWKHGQEDNHPWHDQAALLSVLGWGLHPYPRGVKIINASPYLARTTWLPASWNVIDRHRGEPRLPFAVSGDMRWGCRIRHYAAQSVDERLTNMGQMLEHLRANGQVPS